MKKTVAIVLFTLIATAGISQNLVLNGSFEKFYKCPNNFTERKSKKFLPNWSMPTNGTPDYFNKCSKDMVGVPQNFMGNIHAFEGVGYLGLVLLDTPEKQKKEINYREYIQGQLGVSLQRNELYLVKFYYSVAAYSTFGINRLGVYFSHNKVTQKKGVLNYKPQVYIDTSAIYCNSGEWVQFCDTFRAYGGENYLTIGNFYTDKRTSYIVNNIDMYPQSLQQKINTNQVAYYYIDNISVEKIKKEDFQNEYDFIQKFRPFSHYQPSQLLTQISNETVYLLDETFFDISNNDLPPVSFYQINNLINILTRNPQVEVTLIGLMADPENDLNNSAQRIQRLLKILKDQGIDSSRISGNTQNVKTIPRIRQLYQLGNPMKIYANLVAIMLKTK